MQRRLLLVFLIAASAFGQKPATELSPAPASASGAPDIDSYIQQGWDTLSRSMADCRSLVDPKVADAPLLYLPAEISTPPDVAALRQHCKVTVLRLPRTIHHMGEVSVGEIGKPGLLYLPNRYVVPGGRFNEMYGWDSYFIVLGLLQDHRTELAQGMVENFFFEIEHYGAVLNANRTYYFTRSQPPLLSSMIRAVYEKQAEKDPAAAKAWLARAYGYAERDHKLWISSPHLAEATGLARYDDLGSGPVPEMADDSQYYNDVLRWLLAHPDAAPGDVLSAPENPTPEQAIALAKTSCDVRASKVCARAYLDGHRLTSSYYHGDRAMRESGFDTSFRFGPFSGATEDYAPVCLNSLLYKYERDMQAFANILGRKAEVAAWGNKADARRAAIDRYLWHADKGMYYDYDFVAQRASSYGYLTTFYPLWAGAASKEQAAAVASHLKTFEHDGGLAMSDTASGMQWDLPFGWAPTNWFAVSGLAQYGLQTDADRIANEFMATVRKNFALDGTIREKYNMVGGSADVQVSAGYKSNVVGFGWTNGVYLEMEQMLGHPQITSAK